MYLLHVFATHSPTPLLHNPNQISFPLACSHAGSNAPTKLQHKHVTLPAGVLISVLQNKPIDQYTPSANTAETSGPLKMAFSYISRPLVLQIRFPKTYLGEIKHIPIW